MTFDAYLHDLEVQHGLLPGLLNAVSYVESRHNPHAFSPVGAMGQFQFIRKTAKRFGINPWNREEAAKGAAKYLKSNFDLLGSWELAIAGYNAGEGIVGKCHCIPNNGETPQYVAKVMAQLGHPPAVSPPVTIPTVAVRETASTTVVYLSRADFDNAVQQDTLSRAKSLFHSF